MARWKRTVNEHTGEPEWILHVMDCVAKVHEHRYCAGKYMAKWAVRRIESGNLFLEYGKKCDDFRSAKRAAVEGIRNYAQMILDKTRNL